MLNPYPLENAKVLIVDDARPPRKVLKKLLSDFGTINYFEAESLSAAIPLVEREAFSLIFCDHHLPDATSLELISWMRKDSCHQNQDTPFVVVSSDIKKETLVEGRKLGVNSFLVKPFNIGDLSQALFSALNWTDSIIKFYENKMSN